MFFVNEVCDPDEIDTYIDSEDEELDDTFMHRYTTRGQKEKEKQQALYPDIENNRDIQTPLRHESK
nr:hypothetical protein [Neobacillus sp. Marseille-Q6967]